MSNPEPALTPQEWARGSFEDAAGMTELFRFYGGNVDVSLTPEESIRVGLRSDGESHFSDVRRRRHALAALALHGQPFGFTREDVELLRFIASLPELQVATGRDSVPGQLVSLAERVAALLPPRGPAE